MGTMTMMPATAALDQMKLDGSDVVVSDRGYALERIKQMWDDFDLEEYMKVQAEYQANAELLRSAKAESSMNNTIHSDSPSWRHRVTVPKPFDMTIRDEILTKRKDEKLEKLKREKLERERLMEAELETKRKFRANPVPAHVYLPIYDELARTQEQRRQFVVEHSQQLLRSIQKPFKFTIREHQSRSLQRSSSAAELNQEAAEREAEKAVFRARPVPPSTHDATIIEKYQEKELYRKIQARMRAIELYRSAAMPPSMEARRRAQQELLADSLRKRSSSADRTKKPLDPAVYDRLSQPITRPPLPTRSKFMPPEQSDFFDTSPVAAKSRPRTAAESLAAGRRALRPEAALPTKLTTTSELRMSKLHEKLSAEKAKMEDDEARRQDRERRRREMARLVRERGMGLTPRSEHETVDKERERRHDLIERDQQYKRYLASIEQKLSDRPLLVERVSADVARKQAAQRYREALERAGLTEEEVLHSTTIAAEYTYGDRSYSRSVKSNSDRNRAHQKRDYDDLRDEIQASPIAPASPEDDYAY